MKNFEHKRSIKNFLIAPKYQLRHVLILVVMLIVVLLITGLFYIQEYEKIVALSTQCRGGDLPTVIYSLSDFIYFFAFICFVLVSFGMINIVITHSVFGSLYSIEKYLEKVLAGKKVPPLHYRKGDEAKHLVELINQLTEKVNQKQ